MAPSKTPAKPLPDFRPIVTHDPIAIKTLYEEKIPSITAKIELVNDALCDILVKCDLGRFPTTLPPHITGIGTTATYQTPVPSYSALLATADPTNRLSRLPPLAAIIVRDLYFRLFNLEAEHMFLLQGHNGLMCECAVREREEEVKEDAKRWKKEVREEAKERAKVPGICTRAQSRGNRLIQK